MSPESHPHRPCVAFSRHPCLAIAVPSPLTLFMLTPPITQLQIRANLNQVQPSILDTPPTPHRFPSVLRNNPIVSPCKKPWKSLDSSLPLPSNLHSNHIQSLPLLTAWASPVFVPLHRLRLTRSSGFQLPT